MAITIPHTVAMSSITTGDSLTSSSVTVDDGEIVVFVLGLRDESLTWTAQWTTSSTSISSIANVDGGRAQAGHQVFAYGNNTGSTITDTVTFSTSGNTNTANSTGIVILGADTTNFPNSPYDNIANHVTAGSDTSDMLGSVAPASGTCVLIGFGQARAATLTVPTGETALIIDQEAGTGGNRINNHIWREDGTITASTQLGATGDLSTNVDWSLSTITFKEGSTVVYEDCAAVMAGGSGLTAAQPQRVRSIDNNSQVMAGVGGMTALLKSQDKVSATMGGTGGLTAPLKMQYGLLASMPGVGGLTSSLKEQTGLVSNTMAGVGDMAGTISRAKNLLAAMDGAGTLAGVLKEQSNLLATMSGSASATAMALKMQYALLAASAGVGGMTADISSRDKIAALMAGTGSLAGTLKDYTNLGQADIMAGAGNMAALLKEATNLQASYPGTSDLVALATVYWALKATEVGSSSMTATLTGVGGGGPNIAELIARQGRRHE